MSPGAITGGALVTGEIAEEGSPRSGDGAEEEGAEEGSSSSDTASGGLTATSPALIGIYVGLGVIGTLAGIAVIVGAVAMHRGPGDVANLYKV